MLVKDILHNDIPPLQQTDTLATALTKMDLTNTSQYCVVDEANRMAGMVGLDQVIAAPDQEAQLKSLELRKKVFVPYRQHIFEALRIMLAQNIQSLPVVDDQMVYHGMVTQKALIKAVGTLLNVNVKGSVLTIEVNQNDYSLSELSRIIENEQARILGVAVEEPDSDNPFFRVSFKINLDDSSVLSSALRRFGYTVISEESSESYEMDFSDRADELIRYLDI